MKLAVGCDQNAFDLKMRIIEHLEKKGIEYVDYGSKKDEEVLYPNVAHAIATDVAGGKFNRAIILCGTGIGMAIVANKVKGVRAAVCHDIYSTQRSRMSNDCQIMTMGAQVIGVSLAIELVDVWLDSEYQGGRSKPKVDLINELDGCQRVIGEKV